MRIGAGGIGFTTSTSSKDYCSRASREQWTATNSAMRGIPTPQAAHLNPSPGEFAPCPHGPVSSRPKRRQLKWSPNKAHLRWPASKRCGRCTLVMSPAAAGSHSEHKANRCCECSPSHTRCSTLGGDGPNACIVMVFASQLVHHPPPPPMAYITEAHRESKRTPPHACVRPPPEEFAPTAPQKHTRA